VRVEQGAIPVLLQDTPSALDRIVLGVIRWLVGQVQSQAGLIDEIGQPLHELSAAGVIFWPIVPIQHERLDQGKTSVGHPPEIQQTIDHEISGQRSSRKVQLQLVMVG
jgi:hypothetical protein